MMRQIGERSWEYLERIPSCNREKSDLITVRKFVERLGNPDRDFRIIHVAGTNGKGSVCAMMTAVLREAGITVGTFVSPHLVDIRERFLINGIMVSEADFDAAFEAVYEVSRCWVKEGKKHPTYFEFLFYMALVLFKRAGIFVAVMETGMGGRFDVTNVIEKPLVSVITSISIDHTAFLGNTRTEIAGHKAGIIKDGCPVVYDGMCEEAACVIRHAAEASGSQTVKISDIPYEYRDDAIRIKVPYCGRETEFQVPFAAPYQARNAALAIQALEVSGLNVPAEYVFAGIRTSRWAARMEQILPGVFLDGAHNEDGIREFLKAARMICGADRDYRPKVWLVFAVAADKDYRDMLSEIGTELVPDTCLLAKLESKRALALEELYSTAKRTMPDQTDIRCFETTGEAVLNLLSEKGDADLAFIAGSLYLAGEVKAVIADLAVTEEKHD